MNCKRCGLYFKEDNGTIHIGKKKYKVCERCLDCLNDLLDAANEVALKVFTLPIEQRELRNSNIRH